MVRFFINNQKKILGIVAVIILFAITLQMSSFKKSEAYKIAEEYIIENNIIKSKIGKIEKIKLSLQDEKFVGNNGPRGEAVFTIIAKGDKGKAYIKFEMEKELGIWKMVKVLLRKGDEMIFLEGEEKDK